MYAADTVRQVVERLVDVLERSGVPYVLGGALSLAAWSEPRATADVDVVLWLPEERWAEAVALVASAGVALDAAVALRQARERGMFVGMVGPVRVDAFVPSIPFYDVALARRARATVLGRESWVHSAEVLAVFKLLFFRPKDLIDIERMLRVRGPDFDRSFVRAAIVEMMGPDDPRIAKWDEIAARTR